MSGVLNGVDARTKLSETNKMELLLFSLGSGEKFGINVFKIKEVCQVEKITRTPNMPHGVDGIISLRGHVMPVLNLAKFMSTQPAAKHQTMMVAEFNGQILGFLVKEVDRIVRVDWDAVHPSTSVMAGSASLVTAVTEMPDGTLVSLLDVEQILSLAFGGGVIAEIERIQSDRDLCVFFVDDSAVARKKITEVLDKMDVKRIQATNGREAWERLKLMADAAQSSGVRLIDQFQVILTDAEMPEMDGYALTRQIKADARFNGIPVVMHSSLSSEANRAIGHRSGVDYYVSKFDSMVLSETLRPLLV